MQIKSYKQTSKLEELDEKRTTKADLFFRWMKEKGFKNQFECQVGFSYHTGRGLESSMEIAQGSTIFKSIT